MSSTTTYYAVRSGRVPGVYLDYNEAMIQIAGYPQAACRKFTNLHQAEEFAYTRDLVKEPLLVNNGTTIFMKSHCNGINTGVCFILITEVYNGQRNKLVFSELVENNDSQLAELFCLGKVLTEIEKHFQHGNLVRGKPIMIYTTCDNLNKYVNFYADRWTDSEAREFPFIKTVQSYSAFMKSNNCYLSHLAGHDTCTLVTEAGIRSREIRTPGPNYEQRLLLTGV